MVVVVPPLTQRQNAEKVNERTKQNEYPTKRLVSATKEEEQDTGDAKICAPHSDVGEDMQPAKPRMEMATTPP